MIANGQTSNAESQAESTKTHRANWPKRPGPPRSGPCCETIARINQAAACLAADKTLGEAAQALGVSHNTLRGIRKRHKILWREAVDKARRENGRAAGADAAPAQIPPEDPGPPKRRPEPPLAIASKLRQAIRFKLAGQTYKAAAAAIGVSTKTVQIYRAKYKEWWLAELAAVRSELQTAGHDLQPGLSGEVKGGIRRATSLVAAGLKLPEIAGQLGVTTEAIKYWQRDFPGYWQRELNRSMQAAVVVVTRQAGTPAVMEDPEAFLRRALAVDRWTRSQGRELFPPGTEPTLSSFYVSFYKPNRLFQASRKTVEGYESTLRHWRLLTGDIPLREITNETLTRFRDCLLRLPGKQPASKRSIASLRKDLVHVQAVLDKAGPRGYRNRDAAGILKETPPWIMKPTCEAKPVRIVTPEELDAVYQAAVCMEIPAGLGPKPAAWWRALLVLVYSTGIRRRTALELRMNEVDWERHRLMLPPKRMKSKRAQVIHVSPVAMEHLRRIRTGRELVFQYPHCTGHFHKQWHRLLTEAGIPREKHFGLHDLRKTLATLLWDNSPQAAQLTMGHVDAAVTRGHYVEHYSIEARALDAIPQPAAFTAVMEGVPA